MPLPERSGAGGGGGTMRAFGPVVRTLFKSELVMLLRDRRTIVMSVVLPLAVMPLLLFGSRIVQERQAKKLEETVTMYAVTGSQASVAHELIAATRGRMARVSNAGAALFPFREVTVPDPAKALDKGDIQLIVEAATPAEAVRSRGPGPARESGVAGREREVSDAAGAPVLTLVLRGDRETSEIGARKLRDALLATRDERRAALLAGHGFPVAATAVARLEESDVASKGQVAGLALGRVLTLLLISFIMSGGAVVATDALAGEKERGTLETLLTTAASRTDIVAAKLLAVLAVALTITIIQVANLLVYVSLKVIPTSQSFAAAVPPPIAALLLLLFLPVAALASAVLLLVSGYAKSYKEAQLYFFPLFLLGMVPALAPFLPGLSLRSAIVLVPVSNIAVAVKEILTGTLDWPMIAVAFAVTTAAAAAVTRHTARALSAERLIMPSQADADEALARPQTRFPRHVLRFFAAMWALLVIAGNQIDASSDIRLQLVINLVGIFLGGTMLMIHRYRLDPAEVLALRRPHSAVWVAVLVGAPAGLLTGIGVFRLASLVLPVPREALEGFGQALLPDDIPFAQLLLMLTLLPGVIEEITFRGALLYGLTRRMSKVKAALAVGLVFGIFHFSLFRIVPTAYLGVLLAAATLLSGSIFPAMAWHAINNALGILGPRNGIDLTELPIVIYLAGAAVLAGAFWILWRTRRPYPGR
jgi:sodium transport system permease protein